jgi:5-methylthioadenosine/S-adenosylhomocysteine deaminase
MEVRSMTLLVRGKYVICEIIDAARALIIEDGALAIDGAEIVDRGRFVDLVRKYPTYEILGSEDQVIIPGLIDSHHHVGLTPFQLGSPDLPVELWSIHRIAGRDVDPYGDTLYSAFELVESGVTTVHHIHQRGPGFYGSRAERHRDVDNILRAYSDVGMRVTYSLAMRDQNRFVYESDDTFTKSLPPELSSIIPKFLAKVTLPAEEQFAFIAELWERLSRQASPLVRMQLAPTNLQWCSDQTLVQANLTAREYGTGLHIHVFETAYQREYAKRQYGTTGVRHLYELGVLGPHLTLGHAVWITEEDADLLAATGTYVCHNASSNLRLRSGVAPIEDFAAKGVPLALGIDEAGINDDRDMLQEMRVVLNLHRAVESPGSFSDSLTANQVLRMATQGGAHSTGFGKEIGILEPGRAADLVLIDWNTIKFPYLDARVPVVDAIVRRARRSAVRSVLVAGRPILLDGKFTRIDKSRALEELAGKLRTAPTPSELERIALAEALMPHVKHYYDGWLPSDFTYRRPDVKLANSSGRPNE